MQYDKKATDARLFDLRENSGLLQWALTKELGYNDYNKIRRWGNWRKRYTH